MQKQCSRSRDQFMTKFIRKTGKMVSFFGVQRLLKSNKKQEKSQDLCRYSHKSQLFILATRMELEPTTRRTGTNFPGWPTTIITPRLSQLCKYTISFFENQALFFRTLLSKNEKVNSTHRPPSRFYFCTVDIFSFTPIMVCLELLLTAMEGVYYE